jgi:hypothetical protein
MAAAATLGAGSAAAQPSLDNPCLTAMNSIGNTVNFPPGFPFVGDMFGPGFDGSGVNINSGNNINIQTGPSNIAPVQSSSVGNISSCCINGRCCVQTDGGPATCTS